MSFEIRLHDTIRFTDTEQRVLARLLDGDCNKDIALALGCSVRTVEFHVSNMLRKAGVPTRSKLVVWLNARATRPG